ncbi:MAG: hypothetical protein KatS3mg121_1000 [Gammaproteobacteria bacterium]|nr:MAG: hypothetical protein KatS3mg121_1000 [Gammaproteobacteria bacterium]
MHAATLSALTLAVAAAAFMLLVQIAAVAAKHEPFAAEPATLPQHTVQSVQGLRR